MEKNKGGGEWKKRREMKEKKFCRGRGRGNRKTTGKNYANDKKERAS